MANGDQPFDFGRGRIGRDLSRAAGNIQTAFDEFAPSVEFPTFQAPDVQTQGLQNILGLQGQLQTQPGAGVPAGFIQDFERQLGFVTPTDFAQAQREAGISAIEQGQQIAEQRALETLGPGLARSGTAGATVGNIGAEALRARLGLESDIQTQLADRIATEQAQQRQFGLALLPQFRQQQELALRGALGLGAQENILNQFAREGALTEFGINELLPAQTQQQLEAERLQSLLGIALQEPGLRSQQRGQRRQLAGDIIGAVGDVAGSVIGAG